MIMEILFKVVLVLGIVGVLVEMEVLSHTQLMDLQKAYIY